MEDSNSKANNMTELTSMVKHRISNSDIEVHSITLTAIEQKYSYSCLLRSQKLSLRTTVLNYPSFSFVFSLCTYVKYFCSPKRNILTSTRKGIKCKIHKMLF